MRTEQDWTPGVWINGHPSHDAATTDAFGTFAHRVHEDLLAARAAGAIPTTVEFTLIASTVTPLWGDAPTAWLLDIRVTGLPNPHDHTTHHDVTDHAFPILDRRAAEHVPPAETGQYAASLVIVDNQNQPHRTWQHNLRHPT